jgi:hypothetical protein
MTIHAIFVPCSFHLYDPVRQIDQVTLVPSMLRLRKEISTGSQL